MKKKILFLTGVMVICLTGCNKTKNESSTYIKIKGESTINQSYGEEYKDEGYELNDKNAKVTISSNVDTTKVGEYQVTYIVLKDDKEVERKVRVVKVVDNKAPEITALDEAEIFLNTAITEDSLKKLIKLDVKDNYDKVENIKVEINQSIDTKTEGNYKVTIKATDTNNNESTKEVNVKVSKIHITSINFDKSKLSLSKGGSYTLKTIFNPNNTTEDKTLVWSSSNTSVATVSNGKVSAINYGTSEVCASLKSNSNIKKCITVDVPLINITGINLSKTSVTLTVGGSTTLNASVVPSNATGDKSIVWSSNNEAIAKVSNGKISAIKAGSAQICAMLKTNANIKKCATVKVNAKTSTNADLEKFKKYLLNEGYEKVSNTRYKISYPKYNSVQYYDFSNKTFANTMTITSKQVTTTYTYYYKTDKGTYNFINNNIKMSLTYTYDFKTDKLQCVTNPSSYSNLCDDSTFRESLAMLSDFRTMFKTAIKNAGVNVNNL